MHVSPTSFCSEVEALDTASPRGHERAKGCGRGGSRSRSASTASVAAAAAVAAAADVAPDAASDDEHDAHDEGDGDWSRNKMGGLHAAAATAAGDCKDVGGRQDFAVVCVESGLSALTIHEDLHLDGT